MFKNKKLFSTIITVIFILTSTWIAGWGQEKMHKMSADYRDIVKETLPAWDEQVLKAPATKVWTDRTSIVAVAKAVNDEVLEKIEREKKADIYQDKERRIKIDRTLGYIRYLNQSRQFRHNTSPKTPVEKQKAEEIILKAGKIIALPVDEFQKAKVDTVIAQGGSIETKKVDGKIFREQLVTIERQINNFPVYGSMVRGAVSNKGEVARLLVKWPDFIFAKLKRLRDREAVIEEIVKRIDEQAKGRPISVNMKLGYIPSHIEKKTEYTPGIVVAVLPTEGTGFIFTVPIAE
ncbi:MAG: hypothetical protein AB1480_12460 [Nitrospirota bacterium]